MSSLGARDVSQVHHLLLKDYDGNNLWKSCVLTLDGKRE